MKIAFDAKRAFFNQTGLGNYSRLVIDALSHDFSAHQYIACTPKTSKLYSLPEQVSALLPSRSFHKWFPSYWRTKGMVADLVKNKVDVYHGLSNELPLGIESTSIRKVVTIHDLIFKRYPQYYKSVDRSIYDKKFRSACERANHIVAISEQTRSDLIQFYKIEPNKITVVYQDCHPQFKEETTLVMRKKVLEKYGLKSPYVISVGTLEERKDQLTLLKAFSRSEDKDLHLVLVGRRTTYAAQLDDFLNASGMKDRVHFLEGVSFEDLPSLYQSARACVYASEFEGFGIPVLEGLHSGIPVIASRSSSLPEVGGDAAFYFPTHDENKLAEQLKHVLHLNDSERAHVIQRNRTQADKFSSFRMAEQLNEIYSKVIP